MEMQPVVKVVVPEVRLEVWERELLERLRVLRAGKKYATLIVRFDGQIAQVLEARPVGIVNAG